ncbi:MAG: asparagine synthase (glutamine-hydrolyzing) [Bryobacteraceae bacterium]|nr:asparagine synthase (glutamine-hydrolyzing) [Bryobacteraceae bacterium]
MSGIASIIHFDGRPVEPGEIERMTASMAHRGPDGIRHWVKGNAALGQCQMRPTPESLEETQPWANEDESLVLVMDGRVDNWEELRAELLGCGARLRNRSDAELVLRAYEEWGEECLQHIDGDYGLLTWDARRRRAFCARDRMGVKPFQYHWDGRTLVVASELHAMFQLPWVPRRINDGMMAEYIADEWHSRTETLWEGITRLEPAHWMTVSSAGRKQQRYWEPENLPELVYKRDEEYIEHYRSVLFDVVRRTSRSHAPLAYEVSGGLDSSALFAVANGLRKEGRLCAPGFEGYTLDFEGQGDADEMEFARSVAKQVGLTVHEVAPSYPDYEWFKAWAEKYAEVPPYPNGIMSLGLHELARSRGARVVLTGLGGDEWLGGSFEYYGEELRAGRWVELARCVRRDWIDCGPREAAIRLLRQAANGVLPRWALDARRRRLARKQPGSGEEILGAELQVKLESRRVLCGRVRKKAAKFSLLIDPFIQGSGEWVERQLAAHGLEVRSPYRARDSVEFAFSLPERMLARGRTNKWLHRAAMNCMLPQMITQRNSKAGFSVTYKCALSRLDSLFQETVPKSLTGQVNSGQVRGRYLEVVSGKDAGISWGGFQVWGAFGCSLIVCSKRSSGGLVDEHHTSQNHDDSI